MNLKYQTTSPVSEPSETTAAPAASAPPLSVVDARKATEPYREKRNAYAIFLLASDLGVFGIGQWLAIAGGNGWLQVLGALITWVAIVRLFVIGHDACHQALTSSWNMNHWLGRIAFLVSLTPYSLWRVGHNVVHHGFNNLRGRDFVWEPKTPEEYAALSPGRRALERLYRGAAGPAVYYFVEIWWQRMFFPSRRQMPTPRAEFKLDSLLVATVAVVWIGLTYWYTRTHDTAFWSTLLCAFVVPFILWNWTVGLIVYLHHTHPDIPWYADKREWQRDAAQLSATLYLIMPGPLGPLMHHIMEHPAHHLDATIPLYRLKAAQQKLKELGAGFTTTRFTLGHYLRCVRACKLYDYQQQRWVPFPQ
ncbi:MAG: fatty acid desaturase [Steroidobacteraceae bacterium]